MVAPETSKIISCRSSLQEKRHIWILNEDKVNIYAVNSVNSVIYIDETELFWMFPTKRIKPLFWRDFKCVFSGGSGVLKSD